MVYQIVYVVPLLCLSPLYVMIWRQSFVAVDEEVRCVASLKTCHRLDTPAVQNELAKGVAFYLEPDMLTVASGI